MSLNLFSLCTTWEYTNRYTNYIKIYKNVLKCIIKEHYCISENACGIDENTANDLKADYLDSYSRWVTGKLTFKE